MTLADAARATRQPITDVAAWLEDLEPASLATLRGLGELLVGVVENGSAAESADRFTTRCLGVRNSGESVDETLYLGPLSRLTYALALGELVDEYVDTVEIGPGYDSEPPSWSEFTVGTDSFRHPARLSAHLPRGTLLPDAACVVKISTRCSPIEEPEITVRVARDNQQAAARALKLLTERASGLNPYRGRACRATLTTGLQLDVIELPSSLSRTSVVVDDDVWREIDLGIISVRDRYEMLNRHGLGARRGILLVGPPGTGKSAVSAAVARELVGEFTVIYVDARAGARLLTAVVEESQRIGGPVLLILEDLDLWCGDRRGGGSDGLAELLQAMDVQPEARILTLASTNDSTTLDAAAIRTGRFDAIVEVDFPSRANSVRILAALVADMPGGREVDTAAIADRLPEKTTGSDLRELVRRAVLNGDGSVSTAALHAEAGAGRYKAEPLPQGQYL